uniref:Odorant receptor 36 n=1 Tax=Streltzoviella insularis TaxID=1206366 RepID=A0A7D5UMP3_9NEOP|nr:odorant receptor 36 [Streltzoviella insularis]
MKVLKCLKNTYLDIKNHLQDDSFDSLLWLVNIMPSLAGFSLRRDKIAGMLITSLLFCIYIHLIMFLYEFLYEISALHILLLVDFYNTVGL